MSGDDQIWQCQICNGLIPQTLVGTHLTVRKKYLLSRAGNATDGLVI